jgi:hypothetical protein
MTHPTRHLVTLLTALVALAGLVVGGLGSPAYADTWSRADERGDVQKLTFRRSGEVVKPARNDRRTDITRVTANHGDRRLSLRIHVRDLRLADTRSVDVRIKTATGPYNVAVEVSDLSTVYKHGPWCPRLRHDLDYDANLITISVPRRCLDNPRWVRIGVRMSTVNFSVRNPAVHVDDALSGRRAEFTWRATLGRRIYR